MIIAPSCPASRLCRISAIPVPCATPRGGGFFRSFFVPGKKGGGVLKIRTKKIWFHRIIGFYGLRMSENNKKKNQKKNLFIFITPSLERTHQTRENNTLNAKHHRGPQSVHGWNRTNFTAPSLLNKRAGLRHTRAGYRFGIRPEHRRSGNSALRGSRRQLCDGGGGYE